MENTDEHVKVEVEIIPQEKIETQELKPLRDYRAEIAKWKEDYLKLTINGVEDKEGYKKVDETRKLVKRTKVAADKKRKELKKYWVDLIDGDGNFIVTELAAIEKYLDGVQDPIDKELEKQKEEKKRIEKERVDTRTKRFMDIGALFNGTDYVMKSADGDITTSFESLKLLSDENFNEVFEIFQLEYDFQQSEKKRIADEAEAKRIEQEKKDQEAKEEAERLKQQLEEANAKLAEAKKAPSHTSPVLENILSQIDETPEPPAQFNEPRFGPPLADEKEIAEFLYIKEFPEGIQTPKGAYDRLRTMVMGCKSVKHESFKDPEEVIPSKGLDLGNQHNEIGGFGGIGNEIAKAVESEYKKESLSVREELILFLVEKRVLLSTDLDTKFNMQLTRDTYIASTKHLIDVILEFTKKQVELNSNE